MKKKGTPLLKALFLERRLPWRYRVRLAHFFKRFIFKEIRINDALFFYRENSCDEYTIRQVYGGSEYSIGDLGINANSIIIDVGAHIGSFTIKVAEMATKGKIFSFEPEPSNFRLLKKNIQINKLKNVCLFKKGIARETGRFKLYKFLPRETASYSIVAAFSQPFIMIDCVSLEETLRENEIKSVDLLKLDCEGAEYQILYNTPPECLVKINRIVIEYHDYLTNDNIEKLKEFLQKNGFKMVKIQELPLSDGAIRGIAYFSR